jgi:D-serine dehydratase
MNIFEQVLAFTVPTAMIGGLVYLILNKLLKAENSRRNFELQKLAAQTITPAKLRAYERMVIFLERIAPESMLTRMNINEMTALQLQKNLLMQIKQEWEHNISQQLYIKDDSWIMLSNAKESMIQLVNTCAAEVTLDSTALEYAKHIIETYSNSPKTPASAALTLLKADLAKLR